MNECRPLFQALGWWPWAIQCVCYSFTLRPSLTGYSVQLHVSIFGGSKERNVEIFNWKSPGNGLWITKNITFRIYSNTTLGFVANWNLANGAFRWWIEAVLKCWIYCVCPRSLLVELVNPSVSAHTSAALIHCTDSFFICIKYVLRQFNCLCMSKSPSQIQSPVSCVTF